MWPGFPCCEQTPPDVPCPLLADTTSPALTASIKLNVALPPTHPEISGLWKADPELPEPCLHPETSHVTKSHLHGLFLGRCPGQVLLLLHLVHGLCLLLDFSKTCICQFLGSQASFFGPKLEHMEDYIHRCEETGTRG